ncbi:hypothetical protein GCM10010388_16980 [Streptomyces mauvecolor]
MAVDNLLNRSFQRWYEAPQPHSEECRTSRVHPNGAVVSTLTQSRFGPEIRVSVREDPRDDKPPPPRRGGPGGRRVLPPFRTTGRQEWTGRSGGPEYFGRAGPRPSLGVKPLTRPGIFASPNPTGHPSQAV